MAWVGWIAQMSNLERMRKDLQRLIEEGDRLVLRMTCDLFPEMLAKASKEATEALNKNLPNFTRNYQRWYSEALAAVSVLLPDRVNDFKSYYQLPRSPKELNYTTYTISDYLKGTTLTRTQ